MNSCELTTDDGRSVNNWTTKAQRTHASSVPLWFKTRDNRQPTTDNYITKSRNHIELQRALQPAGFFLGDEGQGAAEVGGVVAH